MYTRIYGQVQFVFTTSVFTTSVFTTSVFTTSVFTTSVRIYGLVRFAVIPAALVLVFHFSFEFFFRIFFLVFRSVCAVSLLGNCGLMVPAAEAWIPFQALFFLFFFCFFVVWWSLLRRRGFPFRHTFWNVSAVVHLVSLLQVSLLLVSVYIHSEMSVP